MSNDVVDFPETSAGPANDETTVVPSTPQTQLGWLAWPEREMSLSPAQTTLQNQCGRRDSNPQALSSTGT
jgi:hypothetical protein